MALETNPDRVKLTPPDYSWVDRLYLQYSMNAMWLGPRNTLPRGPKFS